MTRFEADEGALAATEAADAAAFSGTVEWQGILATTEAADTPLRRRRRRQLRMRMQGGLLKHGRGGGQARLLDQDAQRRGTGALRYVTIGHGTKRPRKMFTDADLNEFIAEQTRKDCRVHLPHPRSPYWHYDFQCRGHRFHGSTKATNRREARKSRDRRAREGEGDGRATEAAQALTAARRRGDALVAEVGAAHAGAADAWHQLGLLIEFFGKDKLADRHRPTTRWPNWWRGGVAIRGKRKAAWCRPSPSTPQPSNCDKLFTRAKLWGVRFPA